MVHYMRHHSLRCMLACSSITRSRSIERLRFEHNRHSEHPHPESASEQPHAQSFERQSRARRAAPWRMAGHARWAASLTSPLAK